MDLLTIPVQETFQQTIQGEGYWSGTPADFIRLSGCPVGCSWCDTGYADGGMDLPRQMRSFADLIGELRSPLVVITGGEPFIHQQLPDLVQVIAATGRKVSLETSGAFWRDIPECAWVTLSPKEHISPRYPVHPKMWERANEIKIVIATGAEMDFYESRIPTDRIVPIFLQPEWNRREQTIPLVLELLKKFSGYRLSLQLHKYLGVP
jgi:organic radical activating enzyme